MSLCKVNIDEDDFFIFSKHHQKDFSIQIINNKSSYTGKVSKDELGKTATDVGMEWEKFYSLFEEAVGLTPRIHSFSYSITQHQDKKQFLWKQILDGGMKFQLGTIDLSESKNILHDTTSIFESIAEQLKFLKKQNGELLTSKRTMEKTINEMCEKMKKFSEQQKNIEHHLYSRFSLVLNEKKRKIRELQGEVYGTSTSNKQKKYSMKEKKNIEKEVDSDDDELTDSDIETKSPTNMDADSTVFEDNVSRVKDNVVDIILDNEIEDDQDKPKTKRKKLKAKLQKTPNTILPRTTSLPRPKRQFSSGSSDSGSEKRKHVQEISEDDLLAEL